MSPAERAPDGTADAIADTPAPAAAPAAQSTPIQSTPIAPTPISPASAEPAPAASANADIRTLEFAFPPERTAALGRALGQTLGVGRGRGSRLAITWLDSADGTLHARGLALANARGAWRLEPLTPPGVAHPWPPATPAPIIASAASRDGLPVSLPALLPLASFEGRQRHYPAAEGADTPPIEAVVATGELRAFAGTRAHGWLLLTGPSEALAGRVRALADIVPLAPPGAGTAALALALARGEAPPPRRLGAPTIAEGSSLAEAAAAIVAHLTDVVLHWGGVIADTTGPGPGTTEAVHQMRVAVRRLRALLAVLRPPIQGPASEALRGELRELAATLGPARDWDVFTTQTTGLLTEALGHAAADQARLAALRAAAARRRVAAHAALRAWLAGPHWRGLALELALFAALRPWRSDATADEPAAAFAARSLAHRARRMKRAGTDLSALDDAALHDLRKMGKKLRYTAEAFRPCLPGKAGKRFMDRLADLQEELGIANDAATASALIGELGGGHAYAAGALVGLLAGERARLRRRIARAWQRFSELDPP